MSVVFPFQLPFGGMRVAVKRGNRLFHLHGDHLGSTSLTTLSSATIAGRAAGGFWGAIQEFCAVDAVCTQQAYDAFGRASHRWEKGVGYPDRDQAQTSWRYYTWGSMGQSANVIVTQSQPRCEGNFVRKLYDGFGQLIQQQSPRQGWETTLHGCSEVENRLETVVDYGYDGLGRLLRTSVPRAVAFSWVHEADWDAGYSATSYDGLSRPVSARAPNGSMTSYHYNGLTASVIGGGEGEAERGAC